MHLMSINIGLREFPNTLTRMLASQEGTNTALSLQGDDASALVDILDQVSRTMMIRPSRLTPLHRPLRLRTWTLISGEGVSASFGESVAHRPSCLVLAYSRTTSRRRATSHSPLVGSRMSGKAATTRTACASKRSALIQPITCQK